VAADELTLESFTPHVGSVFLLRADGQELPLALAAADPLPAPPGDKGRPPFSLEFDGPREPIHPQATVAFDHDALGTLQIFIVPIAQSAQHTRYQAIFT
jgi:hypothetical protein